MLYVANLRILDQTWFINLSLQIQNNAIRFMNEETTCGDLTFWCDGIDIWMDHMKNISHFLWWLYKRVIYDMGCINLFFFFFVNDRKN